MQVLVFTINNYYGLDTKYVDEVIIRQKLTPVPNSNDCIAGLTYVRDSCYTCIDLSNTLFRVRSKWSSTQKFLLTSSNNRLISYIVDEVVDVYTIDLNSIKSSDEFGVDKSLLKGFIIKNNTIITLLDLNGINQVVNDLMLFYISYDLLFYINLF